MRAAGVTWWSRAVERFYFAPFRNAGSHMQLIAATIGVTILMGPMAAYSSFQLSYQDATIVLYSLVSLPAIGLVYAMYRFAWTYRQTGMMLVGEGKRMWSIHMAGTISFTPKTYAAMDSRFMIRGAVEIVKASMVARPGDFIVIETHLLGDDVTRLKQVHKLARAFPLARIWEGQSKKPLNRIDACHINRHKKAFMKRRGIEHGTQIRAGDPRGMIVVELLNRTDRTT